MLAYFIGGDKGASKKLLHETVGELEKELGSNVFFSGAVSFNFSTSSMFYVYNMYLYRMKLNLIVLYSSMLSNIYFSFVLKFNLVFL